MLKPLHVGASGLSMYWAQRVSAVVLLLYALGWGVYSMCHGPMDWPTWAHLWQTPSLRVITTVAWWSALWHAWIGLWVVITDYLPCAVGRLWVLSVLQGLGWVLALWGTAVVWGL